LELEGREHREHLLTGAIAAAAFAAVLIAIIRSPEVREAILGIVTSALSGA